MTMAKDDEAFDAALAALLEQDPAEAAQLSRAVLTRLATPEPGLAARGAEVLALPGPALAGFGGALLLAVAAGYALAPSFGEPGIAALGLFGDLAMVLGGL